MCECVCCVWWEDSQCECVCGVCVCGVCVFIFPIYIYTQRVLTGFLELLSGWSEGGLEVTAHMLHTIAAHAHTGHNREALVQLVSPSPPSLVSPP